MKINKDGQLEIDICSLLDSLSAEDKLQFIETLSCEDAIIKHVADQIFDGFTENVYCGREGFLIEPQTPLMIARERVVKFADETAQKEIDRLKRFAKNQEEQAKKYSDLYWELYYNWPKGYPKPIKGENF